MKKYLVTITVSGWVIPANFNFISADITVWADSAEEAEEYGEAFLSVGVFAEVDSVTELATTNPKENQS